MNQQLHAGPEEFLATFPNDQNTFPELLVDVALTEWLGERQGWAAAAKLARLMWSKHEDRWLLDFMAKPTSGISQLSAAIRANGSASYAKALAEATASARRFRSLGNRAGALRAEEERLYAFQRMLRNPDCLGSAERLRDKALSLPYPALRAQVGLELAACRNLTGAIGSALSGSQSSLEEARTAGDRSLKLRALAFISSSQVDLGNGSAIWVPSLDALEVFWSGPYPVTRAQFLLVNLSLAAEQQNQLFAAYVIRKEALSLIENSPDRLLVALSFSKLGSMAQRLGDERAAIENYARAEKLFAGLQQTVAVREYTIDAQLARATALAQAGDTTAALKIMESLRARSANMPTPILTAELHAQLGSLYQQLGDSRAQTEFVEAVNLKDAGVSGARTLGGNIESLAGAASAYRGLTSVLALQGKWAEALAVWEKRNSTSQKLAGRESPETFLVYATLQGRIAGWVVRAGTVQGRWLNVSPDELGKEAAHFERLCADPNSPEELWRTSARRLYDYLIAPLEAVLPAGGIIAIEADGPIEDIPLPALIAANQQFIGDRFVLVTTDSIAAYCYREQMISAALRNSTHVLAVQDPTLRGSMRRAYPPLPDAEREIAAITTQFRNVRVLQEGAATLSNLARARGDASLFHFAGHGFSNAGSGGLLLAPEDPNAEADVLNSSTLARADWSRFELVVLSACSTGTEARRAVNPESLVRAFLEAGAKRVIASRWNVDSRATATLIEDLYDEIGHGLAPAAALREASVRMRQRERHPYYWAGFQVYGLR